MKNLGYYVSALFGIAMLSCVPARQFEDMKAKYEKCDTENKDGKSKLQQLIIDTTELRARNSEMVKTINKLKSDTTYLGSSFRRLSATNDQLNRTYDLLLKKYEQLLAGNAEETQKISSKLQLTEEDLLKKEDELKKNQRDLDQLKKDLDIKQANLKKLEADLNDYQNQLEQKNKRLIELEGILARQDSVVKALKTKVANALTGFEGKGLSIEQKNGKVYVKMDESLLFASGSWEVGTKGQEALKNIAGVLKSNSDINVVVEGHTDNVPYNGKTSVKDNWDLSVMRATAIVKIMIAQGVPPQKLQAAGRGEYFPIDPANTPEARAKNRRTEIILTPKLDELLKMIENN